MTDKPLNSQRMLNKSFSQFAGIIHDDQISNNPSEFP